MSVTVSQVNEMFKVLGKLCAITNLATASSTSLKQAAIATIDQGTSGQATDFDCFNDVLNPAASNVKTATAALDKLPNQMVTNATTYVTETIGDLLATDAVFSDTLDALGVAMTANQQYITAHGQFAGYLVSLGYANNLPTAGTVLIPDSWITTAIV